MKNSFLKGLFIAMVFSFPTIAQTPQVLWEQQFDGFLSGKDISRSLVIDAQNNILVTGTSYHFFAGGNFSTIKYSPSGAMLWSDHYYSAQSGYDNIGKRIVIDQQGAIYAVGTLAINDGDLAIIKYGPNGRLWTKNYEPYFFSTYEDFGMDIGFDGANNFYAIAQVTSPSGNMDDLYIMKCDSSGAKIWDDNYSAASGPDYPVALAVAPSGTAFPLLQAFNFFGTATNDITTIRYTSTGVRDWFSRYNGLGNSDDYPSAIQIDASENQYVCGTADAGATNDMVVMKQNQYGTRLWTYSYNGTANQNDSAVAVRRLSNGFVVVVGRTRELIQGVARDAITTAVIDSGTVVWSESYTGAAGLGAVPSAIVVDGSDNIFICGYENSIGAFKDGCILKYSASGVLQWNIGYSGNSGLDDRFTDIKLDGGQDIVVTGQTYTASNNANYLTVKYGFPSGIVQTENIDKSITVYPNPAGSSFTVLHNDADCNGWVSVSDCTGRTWIHEKQTQLSQMIDCSMLSNGVYTVQITCDGFARTQKLIISR